MSGILIPKMIRGYRIYTYVSKLKTNEEGGFITLKLSKRR